MENGSTAMSGVPPGMLKVYATMLVAGDDGPTQRLSANNQRSEVRTMSIAVGLEYQALPELDTCGNAVMSQTIKLENEGWERDPR